MKDTTRLGVGTFVLDEWYGLGIIVETGDGKKTSGYRNKVKFFYGKNKVNEYNDREISDLHHNYLEASVRGRHFLVEKIEGMFNMPRK